MDQGKFVSAITMMNLRLNPPRPEHAPAEAKDWSRQAVNKHDLYSYRGYKHWMNGLASWK
jgi:hypothetical protein